MKKLSYILILSLVAFSCEVFEVEPEASISDEAAITNPNGLRAAINGLYHRIQDVFDGEQQLATATASDLAQSVGTWDPYREIDTYVVSRENIEITALWADNYEIVNQANNILEGAPNIEGITEETRNSSLGQAYFARGLAFFNAAMLWGGIPGVYGTLGVPLPMEPSRAPVLYTRTSQQETWDQVEADLTQALNLLPEDGAPAFISKATARAMLARMYLYLGNYEQASNFATQVIDDGQFSLVSDYATIFRNSNTSESIWELQFDALDNSQIFNWYVPGVLGGRGDLAAHTEFYNSIPDEDLRKQLFDFTESEGFWFPTKYFGAANDDNTHLIRLAEMYLIRAEANFLSGKSTPVPPEDDLNVIRTRAGLDPISEITSIDDILEERKVELMYEGHRWFDLIRTGKALEALASVPRDNSPGAPAMLTEPGRQVFPIPNTERNANPGMEQNPAYR